MRTPFLNTTIIAAVLFSTAATAQISDSFYNSLPKNLRPRDKNHITIAERQDIIALDTVGLYHYRPELGLIAAWLIKEAERTKNLGNKIEYFNDVAMFYNSFSHDSAMFYFNKILSLIDGNAQFGAEAASAHLSLSAIYFYEDKYDSAMKSLHNASDIADKLNDSSAKVQVCNLYCLIYSRLHRYQKALYYEKQLLQLYPANKKWDEPYIRYLINAASLYTNLYAEKINKAYQDSAVTLVKSIMVHEKSNAVYWYQACYYLLGYIDYKSNNYTTAISMFDSSLLPSYNRSSLYGSNYMFKGYLYKAVCLIKIGNYPEGEKILKGLKIGTANYVSKQAAYEALEEAAEAKGDDREALYYYKKFNSASDSLNIQGQQELVFETEQKYQEAQARADIAVLENKDLRIVAQRNNLVTTAAVIILFFIILVLILYMRYKRLQVQRRNERQKLADELITMEQEAQLRSAKLQAEFNAVIDSQRKTISQNLHDEVASRVALLPMLIADAKNNADEPAVKKILSDIEAEAKSVYTDVREFMHSLNTSQKRQNYNVVELLESLDLRFGIGRGLEVNYEADTEQLEALFTKQQHAEMYCIIKEAVTNTLKHSDAQKMHISIYLKDNFFHFDIRDFVRGKKQNTSNGTGMGLAGMQQRIQLLKGSLTVFDSADGFNISGGFPVATGT